MLQWTKSVRRGAWRRRIPMGRARTGDRRSLGGPENLGVRSFARRAFHDCDRIRLRRRHTPSPVRQTLEEPDLEASIDSSLRRHGAPPAVHSLHRFVFSVPDLSAAVKFYTDFGLDVRRMGGRADLRCYGNAHRWGKVFQSRGPKRLEYISFGAYPEDFDKIVQRLKDQGVELTSPHALADKPGIWFADPDGTLVELVVSPKVTPTSKQ